MNYKLFYLMNWKNLIVFKKSIIFCIFENNNFNCKVIYIE